MFRRALNLLKFRLERFLLGGTLYRLLFIAALIGLLSVAGGVLVLAVSGGFQDTGDAVWWAFLRLTFAAGTGRGPWLDALCDKIFVVSVVVAVGITVEPPVYSLFLIATREILMTPLAIAYRFMPEAWRREYDFSAGVLGKLTTILQFLAIALAILRSPWMVEVAWAVAVSGAASIAYYVRRAMLTSSRTSDRQRPRARE